PSSRRDLDLVTRRSLTETPGIAAAIERALSRGCHSHSSHHVAMASRYNGLARAHPASAHRRRVRRDCAAADTYLDELHLVADRRVRAREIWTQHGAQPLFPGRSYCRDVAIKHALICTSDLFGAPGSRAEPCHLHPLFPPTSVRVARAPWTRCPELLRQVWNRAGHDRLPCAALRCEFSPRSATRLAATPRSPRHVGYRALLVEHARCRLHRFDRRCDIRSEERRVGS